MFRVLRFKSLKIASKTYCKEQKGARTLFLFFCARTCLTIRTTPSVWKRNRYKKVQLSAALPFTFQPFSHLPRPKKMPKRKFSSNGLAFPGIGDTVEVYWPDDNRYYSGTIAAFSEIDGKFQVSYEDGDTERLNLEEEHWRFGPDKKKKALTPTSPVDVRVAPRPTAANGRRKHDALTSDILARSLWDWLRKFNNKAVIIRLALDTLCSAAADPRILKKLLRDQKLNTSWFNEEWPTLSKDMKEKRFLVSEISLLSRIAMDKVPPGDNHVIVAISVLLAVRELLKNR